MRRSGVSLKIQNSSMLCEICGNRSFEINCCLCKRNVCLYCICDQKKYCMLCNNEKLEKNKHTLIRVPINTETTNIIVVKKKWYCCF